MTNLQISPYDILSFGEPLYEFSQIQAPKGQADFLSGFGGDASNFAIAASRQGANVGMLTQLGNDEFGARFLSLWKKEGVGVDAVTTINNASTGIYFITHNEQGHHFSFMRKHSAASQIKPEHLPHQIIADAKLLHVTAITQAISESSCDSVFKAIEIAKQNHTQVSYDTNLRLKLWELTRARAIINETIKYVDICFPSLDEAQLITGLQYSDDIIDYYLKLGAKIVVLKQGSKGAMLATHEQRISIQPHKVNLVDATAAGDSFAGSFCTHYIKGLDLKSCLKFANATASITITGYGAVAPLPTLNEVKARLVDQ